MNARWLKQNLVVLISVLVFACLLGVIVWLERKASAQNAEIEANLESAKSTLVGLRNLDPYPSTDNIQALKLDREGLQKLYGSLQEAVMQDPLKVTDVRSEIDFVDRLVTSQRKLRELAASHRVDLRDGFAFGFSRYNDTFPCRNPVVKPDECRRVLTLLTKQLLIIEKLMELAISNNVDGIVSIRRVEVEQGGSPVSGSDTFAGNLSPEPKGRYQRIPFDIQLVCSPKALQAFLNSLAKSDWCFSVETVKLGSDIPVIRSPTPGTAAAGTSVGASYKQLLATIHLDLIEFPVPQRKPTK